MRQILQEGYSLLIIFPIPCLLVLLVIGLKPARCWAKKLDMIIGFSYILYFLLFSFMSWMVFMINPGFKVYVNISTLIMKKYIHHIHHVLFVREYLLRITWEIFKHFILVIHCVDTTPNIFCWKLLKLRRIKYLRYSTLR